MKNSTEKEQKIVRRDSLPPGGVKMLEAMRSLLGEKEFNAITTAEIASVSKVNEALIYKYFGSKRGLLHSVLFDCLDGFLTGSQSKLKGIKGTPEKLRKLIWEHINLYVKEPLIGKILILEARNYPGFFDSGVYGIIRDYTHEVRAIVEEGIRKGEIRKDIPSWTIVRVMMGAIEHVCLPKVIFGREVSSDDQADRIFNIVFGGVAGSGRADR